MRKSIALAIAVILAAAAAGFARVDTQTDIDRRLFNNASPSSTDEFDRELFAPQKKFEANAAETGPKQTDPFVDVAQKMRDVEKRIARTDSGKDTQNDQKRIMEQLELMIEQMRNSCCGGGKPGEKQPDGGTCKRKTISPSKKACQGKQPGMSTANGEVARPQPDSGQADMEQVQAIMKRLWGELPQRDREQMLQYPVEQFLPEYEQLIEEYYKRLSREQ